MRQTLSRSHTLASLRPCSEAKSYRQLRPFRQYVYDESQNKNQSAVNAEGELWEQETLQLRVTPPTIDIDNEASEDATKITLCSANRPGTLVEVVTRLVELSLVVKSACISSDRGWFADDFYVTEQNGEKVTDPDKIEQMRKILCVEPGSMTSSSDEGTTVLEMSGQDRPGLLADITQLLSNDGYDVKSAAVWTQGMNVAVVTNVMSMREDDNARLSQVCQKLKMELTGPGPHDCAVVSPTRCRGRVHDEHRLHFMLLTAKKNKHLQHCNGCAYQGQLSSAAVTVDDLSYKYRSPKLGKPNVSIQPDQRWGYWIVSIRCKDRSKLLFDTVCTLADLDFDVYHGSVDCRNDLAVLELFVRPRYHHFESIHDRIDEVQQFLEGAIIRRFPKGLKLHVHPFDKPGCLGGLLHALKSADLCVTRAKVRCNDYGKTVHTVYVMNSNGSPPEQSVVEDACRAVGGKLMLSESQGSGSDICESESLDHKFAFFLKERTVESGWTGKPRSV